MEANSPDRARAGLVARNAASRARTSNREHYLPGVDGRSVTARRYHDIAVSVISDQGGHEQMSEARLHLCKRLAAVNTMIEQLEAKFIAGESIDMDKYLAMVNTAVRLSNTLGLNRRTKSIPNPRDYLQGKYGNGNRNARVRLSRTIEHDPDEFEEDD